MTRFSGSSFYLVIKIKKVCYGVAIGLVGVWGDRDGAIGTVQKLILVMTLKHL